MAIRRRREAPRRGAWRLAALAALALGPPAVAEPALEVRLADIRASGLYIYDCSLRIELRNGLGMTLKGFAAELLLYDADGRAVARKPFEMARIGPGALRGEGLGFRLAAGAGAPPTSALELQHQCDLLASATLRLRACESEQGSMFDQCLAALVEAPASALPITLAPGAVEEAVDYGVVELPAGARAASADSRTFPALGATLSAITAALGRAHGLSPASEGLLVTGLAAGGAAAAAGLVAGDVLAEIDQQPVLYPRDVESALARARSSGQRSLLVLVDRDRAATFRVIRLTPSPDQ